MEQIARDEGLLSSALCQRASDQKSHQGPLFLSSYEEDSDGECSMSISPPTSPWSLFFDLADLSAEALEELDRVESAIASERGSEADLSLSGSESLDSGA